ncbi:MAG: hypothetical protein IPP26_13260 [Flavobacteriales bacterium]|nr:hypothetical protein [Flavobacteriales bacterium]
MDRSSDPQGVCDPIEPFPIFSVPPSDAHLLLIPLLVLLGSVHGQHLDPDQQPYWTRYTFVEDSAVLVPLKGDYQVFYLQSGMWWTYMPPDHRIHGLPEKGLRLQPVFSAELPKFQATPARGTEQPEVKVVVVREQDTMVVTLSTYYQGMDPRE